MNQKLILIIFISSLLLGLIPYEIVSSSSIIEFIGFEVSEGGAGGQPFPVPPKTSIINTDQCGGTFWVTTASAKTGSNGFEADGYGFWNLSYSGFLTKFKTMMYFARTGGLGHNSYNYFYFYNKTYLEDNSMDITTAVSSSANRLQYIMVGIRFNDYYSAPNPQYNASALNSAGNWASIFTLSSYFSGWDYFSFEITNSYGYCQYIISTNGLTPTYYRNDTVCNTTKIINEYKIDSCYIYGDTYLYNYIDDVYLNISTSYTVGVTTECGIDLSAYSKVGIDITPQTMDLSYPTFQKVHYTNSYGYLYAISLAVNPSMFDLDPNTANYIAEVIGFNLGGADCFYNDGYQYRLIWLCNIDLGERVEGIPSGRKIDIMFTHDVLIGSSKYWQVCFGGDGVDLDSDGEVFFKLWNNARTKIYYDVGVSYYFDPSTQYQPPDSIYSDSLGFQNWITKNSTGYYYDINQPEGIVCSYLLSQISAPYQNKIIVLKNGSYHQNFTNLIFNSGVVGLCPDTIGTYTFKLYNFHYIDNLTAYVGGTPNLYFISSNPIVTNPYETYNIFYRYYNPLGLKGVIGIFENYLQRSSFVYAESNFPVDNNQTSYVVYPSGSINNEYLTLFINSSYKQAVAYAVHYIRDNNIMENNIYVSPDTVKLGNSLMIYGSHKFPSSEVSIFVNGIEKFSVKDEQTFNRTFLASTSDRYNISLRLKQNGSWVTLKYCFADVTEETGEGELIFGIGIEPPYSYFAGIFIVIISTLSPLLILGIIKKDSSFDLSTIPQFLYLIMAVVGFIISILLGFFPTWSVIVLVIVGALIITILYLKGNSTLG